MNTAVSAGVGVALAFVPWKRGVYWVLACRATECFVIAAARVQ
jgi:hypothetical protein